MSKQSTGEGVAGRASGAGAGRGPAPADAVIVLGPPTWPPPPFDRGAPDDSRTVVVSAGRPPAGESAAEPDAVVRLGAGGGANAVAIDDLTGLSMRLDEALGAGEGGLLRFDDLGRMAVACNVPRLVRFLQMELPRATHAGYAVLARFEPGMVGTRTKEAVTATFDRRLDAP